MAEALPLFKVGQVIRHKIYGYRGVIVKIDQSCQASDAWYQANQTQPERDQPWYHVLVSDSPQVTYPAQSSLLPDESFAEVTHPLVPIFFDEYKNGHYLRNTRPWPSNEIL